MKIKPDTRLQGRHDFTKCAQLQHGGGNTHEKR